MRRPRKELELNAMKRRNFLRPQSELSHATTYSEWMEIAQQIDLKSGKDKWKKNDVDNRYDYRRIRDRLEALRHARETHDEQELLFALNEGLHGNVGGIGNPALYDEAVLGTKDLIADYMAELERAIRHMAAVKDDVVPFEERLDFFRRASHCYGRTALMLSGAGSLSPYHFGVISALHGEGFLPDVISGSSGGAIIAAIVGTRTPAELDALLTKTAMVDLAIPDGDEEIVQSEGAQVSTTELMRHIERLLPDLTFEEAFEVSGKYINISVAPTEQPHQKSRLLNVITSPHVFVREAVRASCAVPGVHPPCQLAAKDYNGLRKSYLPELKWIDGAISDDLPARRLSRLYGVNHTIASQTNPAYLWSIQASKRLSGPARTVFDWSQDLWRLNVRTSKYFSKPLTDRIESLASVSHIFYSMALQEFTADVTIIPNQIFFDPRKILAQISREETLKLIESGQRSTWPEIERIRNSTRVSIALSEILEDYEPYSTIKHHHPLPTIEAAKKSRRSGGSLRD
ncbi:DUF3336 domain-containing protein [Hyphomonas sp.]|uniref:DUF3336 domain-containing protein n=1 Tax=Hyphomonas sp. TaxID=87 RepID=UPI0032EF4CC9